MIENIFSIGLYQAILIFIVILFSVSFHESAHALVAKLLGDNTSTDRISLNPADHFEWTGFLMMMFTNFGWGKPVMVNETNLRTRRSYLMVAIAGPLSNILLALLSVGLINLNYYIYINFNINTFSFIIPLLYYFVEINVGLAVFNLLPIPPLDGSSILREFLPIDFYSRINTFQYLLILFVLVYLPIFNGQTLIAMVIYPAVNFAFKFIL